ncbi:MAG: flagellar biosynthesis anti-sigma factor FlgM [Selenomonadaceae bacterium]|nr:flagellar biosynthesis anti-sigma factor FlgM [Selenomonadaceae bacterium]
MIVNNVNSSSKYYPNSMATRYATAANSVRGVQRNDAFIPSKEAQTFSDMLNKLKNESEVREDRVNELQQKIASGQYFISADNLAAGILTSRY